VADFIGRFLLHEAKFDPPLNGTATCRLPAAFADYSAWSRRLGFDVSLQQFIGSRLAFCLRDKLPMR